MLDVLEGVAQIHVVERQPGTIEIEAELPQRGAGPHLQRDARSGGARERQQLVAERVGERLRVGHERRRR